MNVLGIETSCDDTSLALFSTDRGLVANLTANQTIHERYGGVVPEIASRTHIKSLLPLFEALLTEASMDRKEIDGVGVSNGPGLVGSLLVGVGFAKALAFGLEKPLVGVHHIEAHILSNELQGKPLQMPALVLVVSGGHTALYRVDDVGQYKLLGTTRDDAAGEAFDKIAKLLGLGFPGGPEIQRVAANGDPTAIEFPRAMLSRNNFDFSFSGLKTAVRLHVEGERHLTTASIATIAASAQEAIVDVLVTKTIACARRYGIKNVYVAGGVAANGPLRDRFKDVCQQEAITFYAPLLAYCTDNGAMVACAAAKKLKRGCVDSLALDVFARGPVVSWAT